MESDVTTGSSEGASPITSGGSQGTIDVDRILADVYAPKTSPLDAAPSQEEAAKKEAGEKTAEQTGQPVPNGMEFKVIHKGKEVSLDPDKYKDYAQKGLDYAQNIYALKQERAEFERSRQEFESQKQLLNEWAQLDEYARANPQWAQLVKEQYQRAQTQGFVTQPVANYQEFEAQRAAQSQQQLRQLSEAVESLQSRLQEQDAQAMKTREAEREKALQSQIETYKEKYAEDFDWSVQDELGNTLEANIMQFGIDNEIKRFDLAANAYLADKIRDKATLKAKEQAGKEIQKQTKLGLGKITSKPQLQLLKDPGDLRKKSYHDLAREALAQFGGN